MVLEFAQIDVKPGMEAEFEQAVAKSAPLFRRATGCTGMELRRSAEKPQRYRLFVHWNTLENHTVDFRQSAEKDPLADLIDRWMPSGLIAHIQFNVPNRRGPGQGAVCFAPVLAALRRNHYAGWGAVEPFDCQPDDPAAAARAIGYLRAIEESLAWQR